MVEKLQRSLLVLQKFYKAYKYSLLKKIIVTSQKMWFIK